MKDIEGYEGLYAITSCGKVWSYRRKKFLKPAKNKKGYLLVGLRKDNKSKLYQVHRLVAMAYLPNPNNLPQVNHIDENKEHNWINNLEWCDAKYNNNYGTRTKKTMKKVKCIETSEIFESVNAAAAFVNRHPSCVSSCIKGKTQTCGGLHFQYFED